MTHFKDPQLINQPRVTDPVVKKIRLSTYTLVSQHNFLLFE